jgi:hypothetical protein
MEKYSSSQRDLLAQWASLQGRVVFPATGYVSMAIEANEAAHYPERYYLHQDCRSGNRSRNLFR